LWGWGKAQQPGSVQKFGHVQLEGFLARCGWFFAFVGSSPKKTSSKILVGG